METLSRSRRAFVLILTLVLIPSAALAQATLSGVVKDDSGAFLPGVMVEAHSSVLQREARTVSDSKGEFTLSNLPSGRYKVTFTLSGFDIASLDGVELREATIGVTAVAAIDHGGCAAFRSTGRCLTNREVAVDVPPPFRPLWVGEIRDLEALQAGYPCDRISLSQGGGLLFLPGHTFSVALFKDGRAELTARQEPDKDTRYVGRAEFWDFGRLCYLAQRLGIEGLARYYMNGATDNPGSTITVGLGDRETTVLDYGGSAPIEVWALENAIEAVKNRIDWKVQ